MGHKTEIDEGQEDHSERWNRDQGTWDCGCVCWGRATGDTLQRASALLTPGDRPVVWAGREDSEKEMTI